MRRRPSSILDSLTGATPPEVGQLGQMGGAMPGMEGGAGIDQQQGVGMDSSMLSDEDLAGMAEAPGQGDYEDLQLQQMEAALTDPSTPPDQRAMLEQQLALAARRRLAGV